MWRIRAGATTRPSRSTPTRPRGGGGRASRITATCRGRSTRCHPRSARSNIRPPSTCGARLRLYSAMGLPRDDADPGGEALDRLLAGYRPLPGIFDEMMAPTGRPRAHWQPFLGMLAALGPDE